MVSEARVAGEDLQGRHRKRKNKEERMKSVLEGWCCCTFHAAFRSICLTIGCLVAILFPDRTDSKNMCFRLGLA